MARPINHRTLLRGATALIADPVILSLPRGAQAATTMTLGHNAAPGSPRGIACDEFARLVA